MFTNPLHVGDGESNLKKKTIFARIKWNVQICAEKSILPFDGMEVGVERSIHKKLLEIIWYVQICTEK